MEILYGRNPVLESLRAGRRSPGRLFLDEGAAERGTVAGILSHALEAGLPIERLPRHRLQRVVGHRRHQGVALETSDYPYLPLAAVVERARQSGEPHFFLVVDLLQDPQNMGGLFRTAEAVGVHGIIMQERRTAGVTPAVVNASSGAVEYLSVARVTNLVRAMRALKEEGIWLFGLESDPEATSFYEADLDGPIALVVGGEATGLRRLVRDVCDVLVNLPMRGRVESLNAAIAGSVALYGVWQQRGFGGM